MGLFQKAVETYDAMEHLAGVYEEGKEPLAPIGHIVTGAKIEISIDRNGRFISAVGVDKKITIPVTESSSGRTSAPEAHPLCEQLGYLNGKDKKKRLLYLEQLKEWSEQSENEKLRAVYQYVSSGRILEDLRKAELLHFSDDGEIKNEKDLICWRVVGTRSKDSAVWTDKSLQLEFVQYYLKKKKSGDVFSTVSGEIEPNADTHLKGVVSFAGNAKLVSSNDTTNFTFRGRFLDQDEAMSIGYMDSQKAHNALKWIVSNQKVVMGNRVFVCWNPMGVEIPKPSIPILFEDDAKREPSEYKDELYKTISGWKSHLPTGAEVVIASFEAATSGRLSVTYFNNFSSSDFLERLLYWDETCSWYDNRWGTESPLLYNIVKYAFGTQRGIDDSAKVEADDRLIGQHMQRLLICRLEKAVFPQDIMRALVHRASRPECYNKKHREIIVFTTCAVVRKYRKDRFKEEWNMALEPTKKDRSYQFGRLLAILEKAERDTYEKSEGREPNAIRMQSIFVQRPGYASKIILDQVKNAYYPKLSLGQRTYYEKMIGEIMQIISELGDDEYNKPLKETYIMGYYLQKNMLYTQFNSENKEDSNNE